MNENGFIPAHLKVMIICDDSETGYIWSHLLQRKGIEVFLTNSNYSPIKPKTDPDLLIIDDTLSKFDGLKIIQELRPEIPNPIILLTTNNNETYVLKAYQAGVDECVTKPLSPTLFLYRVRALLRRAHTIPITGLERVQTDVLTLDPIHRMVILNRGKEVKLSQLEFRLLHLLMQNPAWVYKPDQIITAVWGYSGLGDNNLLKHLIFRLRQKIEENPRKPKIILTEPGVGYKFNANNPAETGS